MFNTELQPITPKTKPAEPCGMTIGLFPEPESQIEIPLEEPTNES